MTTNQKREFSQWEAVLAAPLVKEFEGLKLEAYLCPAGVPTIGYGHTGGVRLGERVTKQEADRLLTEDLEKFKLQMRRYVTVPVTRGQFVALLDFCFNLGAARLRISTLLKHLNAGHEDLAANEFHKWRFCNGKVLEGLVRRRAREEAFFRGQA